MLKVKSWFSAARLRTLPLSISGIIIGATLAHIHGYSNMLIFILALLATISFQITSNFANDYGDGVKGTDNEHRVGPKRALQSGLLSKKELKIGIYISVIINVILIFCVVYTAFGIKNIPHLLLFIVLGMLSIWAAIKYTVGDSAYGYRGLGDIFVFLFFGLLAVLGTMFLFTKFITVDSILPAIAIGLLSTGVLNLNNLRDYESDKKSNKNTLVVKMGYENGKIYHYSLLIVAFLSVLLFVILNFRSWQNILCLIAFFPVVIHLLKVYRINEPRMLDPELKKIALSTFLLAVLFFLGYNNFFVNLVI